MVMVKPDGVGAAQVGGVVDRFEREGFRLLALKMIRPTVDQMEGFYGEHRGKVFYGGLVKFMTSGPVVPMVWAGEQAIARARALIGATDPALAGLGTLRREWGTDGRRNLVHASDSLASAEREIAFFFSPQDIAPYDPDRWRSPEFAPVAVKA